MSRLFTSAFPKLFCISTKAFVVMLLVAGMALSMSREAQAQRALELFLGEQIELDLNEGDSHLLSFGSMRILVSLIDPSADDFDELIRVSVAQKGRASYIRNFETGFAQFITIGAFQIDRDGTPSIIMQNYTGGAHCCMEVYSLYLGEDEWLETELAFVDGGTVEPQDLDGDGFVELVIPDGRYFYTFDSYANSYAPSIVIGTYGGDFVDLTGSEGNLSLLLDEYDEFSFACIGSDGEAGSNSACASMLAVASRLGIFEGTLGVLRNLYLYRSPQEFEWAEFTISSEDGDVTFDNLPDAAAHAVVQWNIR